MKLIPVLFQFQSHRFNGEPIRVDGRFVETEERGRPGSRGHGGGGTGDGGGGGSMHRQRGDHEMNRKILKAAVLHRTLAFSIVQCVQIWSIEQCIIIPACDMNGSLARVGVFSGEYTLVPARSGGTRVPTRSGGNRVPTRSGDTRVPT